MDITTGVRRIGIGLVNAYLLEESGEVTIVDAGLPGSWTELPAALDAMGRSLEDVRAVVLTHAHMDHIGFAERIRRERSVPIEVHEADAALARGEVKAQGQRTGRLRPLPLIRFLAYALRRGGLRSAPIREVVAFGDGATLDVPGAPRVILTPGHTPGSASLHVPSRGVLFVGDALATYNVADGSRGPQLAPFGSDWAEALRSLVRIEDVDARWVLPGHGEPWSDGAAAAVAAVRRRADGSGRP